MHIREVSVRGIRSLDNINLKFKRGINAIVGDNGTGKSNVLFAIKLVLHGHTLISKPGEFAALLHHVNANQRRNTGHVEIFVEDLENRFLLNEPFVRIRCTVAETRTWHSVNGQPVSKSDITTLFKLAGLSMQNDFCTLNRGSVASLVEASSGTRLTLFKDFIGVSEYEKMLRQCQGSLERESNEKTTLNEQLFIITSKEIEDLEDHMQKWKLLNSSEEARNAIKFVVYSQSLNKEKQTYSELKEEYEVQKYGLQQNDEDLSTCAKKSAALQKNLKLKQDEINVITAVINTLKTKMDGIAQTISEEDPNLFQAQIDAISQRLERQKMNESNERDVTVAEMLFGKFSDACKRMQMQIKEENHRLVEKMAEHSRLIECTSKEEREIYLNDQLDRCNAKKSYYEEMLSEAEGWVRTFDDDIKTRRSEFENLQKSLQEYGRLLKTAENKHKEKVLLVRDLYAQKEGIRTQLMPMRERVNRLEAELFKGNLKSFRGAVEIIKEWAADGTLGQQYHGLLVEHIRCDPKYHTAIDVVAGKRLLFHVVETSEFATRLVKKFNRKRLPGSIDFIALDRVPSRRFTLNAIDGVATPLLDNMQYDPRYDRVMNLIFGNVFLCKDEDDAVPIARTNRANCVMLDGTYCSSKGALSGGYYTSQKSKMHLHIERLGLERTGNELEAQLNACEENITEQTGNRDQLLQEISKLRHHIDISKAEMNVLGFEETRMEIKKSKKNLHHSIRKYQSCIKENDVRINFLNEELARELPVDLPSDELQRLLETCKQEVALSRDNITLWSSELEDLQNRVATVKKDLEKSKKTQEILLREAELADAIAVPRAEIPATQQAEIDEILNNLTFEFIRLGSLKEEMSKLKEMLEAMETRHCEMQSQRQAATDLFVATECKMKNCLTQIAYLKVKLSAQERTAKPALVDNFMDYTKQELFKSVAEFHRTISDLSPRVNRQAVELCGSLQQKFEECRNKLAERLSCTKVASDFFEEFRKSADGLISQTYEMIKARFQEQFRVLVLGGDGVITMSKENGTDISGMEISVSFDERRPTNQLKQLSGSQKSLVALALMLSMHAVERTPVYLLDEIDASLDPNYLEVVANEIQRLRAQFIVATLKPELVNLADRHFGVTNRNGVSYVRKIARLNALFHVMAPGLPHVQRHHDGDA